MTASIIGGINSNPQQASGVGKLPKPQTKNTPSPFQTAPSARCQGVKLGLFVLWLSLVLFMACHHAFWRDEVRALSIALQGENIVAMLKSLRGEGHPALWYLLLRVAYFVVGSPVVLPLVSISIATAAALLLVLRSPFRWWMNALLLMSSFLLFEYSVMARNYGISVLLLFLLANYYPRYRDRSIVLGILLFLLANTNAHSVLLAGAFLLYWLLDILLEDGFRWTRSLRTFLVNAAIGAAGVAICFATIYPPYNDAAVAALPDGITSKLLMKAVLVPGAYFVDIVPDLSFGLSTLLTETQIKIVISLMLFGSVLAVIRSPAAFIATLAALIALSLFFAVIYWGRYRHQALWLVFLLSMYWITRAKTRQIELAIPARLKSLVGPASAIGASLMVLLLAQAAYSGVKLFIDTAAGGPPFSRVRDFSAFIGSRSDLRNAIIIAEPDFLLEALPYYIQNPTYLMREGRFGNVVKFTRKARLSIDLDDILATARALRAESGKPVLILLNERLDPSQPARIFHESYAWTLLTTPEQVHNFLTSTQFLERFAPAVSDESFDVYQLDRP